MQLKWSYLKPGDIIDIIATTPGIKTETLEQDLLFLSNFIIKLGLIPRFNFNDLLNGAAFFSNESQTVRQQSLEQALLAQDSKAIWFIRGGYGTAQLLPNLVQLRAPIKPKLLIGYSDINCLHLWLHKFWQWPSLHARVLYEFLEPRDQLEIESLVDIIFGKREQVMFQNLASLNQAAKQKQQIQGVITGGTMQVLQSGIGLSWQFDATDKILFFEEIFDRGVRLNRTLLHFMELGLLQKAKAILFGDIICGKEVYGTENCDLAIKNFAQHLDIPVLHIANIGHGELNFPLPLNSSAELIIDQEVNLICSTGGALKNN